MTEKIINPYTDVPFADLPIDPPGTRFGSQSLNDVSEMQIGSKKNVFRADQNGIWLGRSTFEEAKSATFSVDMDGNIVASSLRRRDFQWFTFFESLDGFQNNSIAGGSLSVDRSGILLSTGSTSGAIADVIKGPTNDSYFFTWDKPRAFKCVASFLSTASNQYAIISTGNVNQTTNVDEHISFFLNGNTLYGHQADGTNSSYTVLQTITAGTVYSFEAVFSPGVGVSYYVNGVLKATITTNYPTPTGGFSYQPLHAYIQNSSALNKQMLITMFDFWQAN